MIDKNDTNVTSEDGYLRTLTFYDNLGYSYTAKFSFKDVDTDAGTYSVELVSLTDSNGNDILADYLEENPDGLSDIFGLDSTRTETYTLDTTTYNVTNGEVSFTTDDGTYYMVDTLVLDDDTGLYGYNFQRQENGSVVDTIFVSITDLYGISQTDAASGGTDSFSISTTDGSLTYTYSATDYTLQFSTEDGTFDNISGITEGEVSLNLSVLGDNFDDIVMDFSHMLNQNNGGSSTAEITRGTVDDATDGAGKQLGTLTGISIDSSGKIYGSYDNGNTLLLGQIAVAQFTNASGLESLGDNCYGTTLNSGDFDGIGVDITDDGGSMATGQLEMSNVDLATEFTEMITTQRGYQANARIITVSDSMLEELISLKRS